MATSNKIRAVNRLPYDFQDGLKISGVDVTQLKELSTSAGASKVGYMPAGGGVATTVESKLREFVSVKDFGAVGDGVTDDTAAIQAAINASNGNVDFGSFGVFRVTGPVGLPTIDVTGTGSINLIGSGATIQVESAEAIFTSERSRATPDSTSNLYTAKINVKGLNFIGYGAASVVFNGDRLYNLYVLNCNFKSCKKVIYSYRSKGAAYLNGYLQSVAFVNCHFAQNTIIVDAKKAFNFVFDGNFCENNIAGIYIDEQGDPSINVLRVVNNLFEAGGVFLKIGQVLGGVISGNYLEANTIGDTVTLKCHIHMVRTSGGYTSGCIISNNAFQASASQMTDVDWRDIKFQAGVAPLAGGQVRAPVIQGNWSNSYQLFTENSIAIANSNGGRGGDQLAQRMMVPTPHEYAGVSFSRYYREFLASAHLTSGVFNIAEISTDDIKSLLGLNSGLSANTVELTLMLKNKTAGNVCIGSSVAKILLVVQGAEGGGDVDTMFVSGSLISFAQIQTGAVFDTRFGSVFKQHFTNPTLSIAPNGADNYYIQLSGYVGQSTPNYGSSDRIFTSGVMQVNSGNSYALRGLTRLA